VTGKTDMVPVLNLPSHLSQPSQSENVPIFGRGTRCYFAPEKSRFWSKPREGKGKFTATPRLAPVARGVAACGPLCGLAGRRWGTDTLQPIWARVGELFGAPKAKQEKGRRRGHPRPGHFCPQCGQFHRVSHRGRKVAFSVGGGDGNRKSLVVTRKTAGSRQNFKEEN